MIVSLLHIVWYCKFCEESQYYDFADISAFALHRNFYGYFRSQICRLMSALMSFRIYLMMLFLKALLTKDSTEGLRRSTLKRSKLNCWKNSCWVLINGYDFKLHIVIDINGTAWKWEWYSSCRWKILKIGDKIPKNYSKISSMTKLVIKKYDMAWKSSARHWLNPYLIYWK